VSPTDAGDDEVGSALADDREFAMSSDRSQNPPHGYEVSSRTGRATAVEVLDRLVGSFVVDEIRSTVGFDVLFRLRRRKTPSLKPILL
jgi:hypothetical protein